MPTRLLPDGLRRRIDWTWPALAMLLTGLVVSAWTAVVSPLLLPKRLRDDGPPLRAVVVAVMLTGAGLAFIERERSSSYYKGNRLAFFLSSTSDAVIAANRAGRISYANHAALLLFRRQSLDGLPIETLIPIADRAAHRQAIIRNLNRGDSERVRRQLSATALRFDGTEFPVSVTITGGERDPFYFWAVIHDQAPDVTAARAVTVAMLETEAALGGVGPGEANGNVAE